MFRFFLECPFLGCSCSAVGCSTAHGSAERAARFARRLNGRFQLPVETVDERLSTFEAKQHLKDQGRTPSSYREDPVDSLAAALLLQTWLSSQSKET